MTANNVEVSSDIDKIVNELSSRIPFDRIEPDHLLWLAARFSSGAFPKGTAVLVPGQVPDKMYFVRKGGIQLEAMGQIAEEKKILAEVGEGECFPLEALFEKRPVFSTFRTKSDTDYYSLPLEDYLAFEEMSPLFRDYLQHRSDGFLESTRTLYHAHYSSKGTEQFTLDSPLSLLARSTPAIFSPDASLKDVVLKLASEGLDVAVIVNQDQEPIGMYSTEDLLVQVSEGRLDTDSPVALSMKPIPVVLGPQNYGHQAALLMAMHGYKRIPVTDNGKLVGIVAERDLFSLQRVGLSEISNMIRRASSMQTLIKASKDIQLLASNMLSQGVAAEQLTRIISTLNDHLTERIIHIEFEKSGITDIRFCWLALGSEGRFEQTFCTDQDNGIIFELNDGQTPDKVREILVPVAQRINNMLAECGFSLCKGNIMAGNPQWCLSAAEWKKNFSAWIEEPIPEALLNATIFFDFRPLYGEDLLARELRNWLVQAAAKNRRFIHLMVENAIERSAPISFFNNFVLDKNTDYPNTIDLKLSGVALFVDAARIFSLANGLPETSTELRFSRAVEAGKIKKEEAEAWIDAFYFIQMLRLGQQFEQERGGKPMHNRVNPNELNELDRRILLESLKQAAKVQKNITSAYRIGSI